MLQNKNDNMGSRSFDVGSHFTNGHMNTTIILIFKNPCQSFLAVYNQPYKMRNKREKERKTILLPIFPPRFFTLVWWWNNSVGIADASFPHGLVLGKHPNRTVIASCPIFPSTNWCEICLYRRPIIVFT